MSSLFQLFGVKKDNQAKETAEPVQNFITGISVIAEPAPPTNAAVESVLLRLKLIIVIL